MEGSNQGKAEQAEFQLVRERMCRTAWGARSRCAQAVYKSPLRLARTLGG